MQSLRLEGTRITEPPEREVARLLPEPAERLKVAEVYHDIFFPKLEQRPYVLINMVSSLDGKAVVKGTAGSIGGVIDRMVMRNLRAHADAVMIGASTLRAEKLTLSVTQDLARQRVLRGLEPEPLSVLTTVSGNLPLEKHLLDSTFDNLLVFVSPSTPSLSVKRLSSLASVETVTTLNETLQVLKQRYAVDVLLVEGGPSLNHALVSEHLVDELFLTLSPKLLGGESNSMPTILEGPTLEKTIHASPVSIHAARGELFLRYTLEGKSR